TDRVGGQQPGRVDRGRLQEDCAGSPAGPRLVVGNEVIGWEVVVNETGLVRGRDDPIAHLDRAKADRREQRRKRRVRGHDGIMPHRSKISYALARPSPARGAPAMKST